MDKRLLGLLIVLVALLAYAMKTAKLPPATVEYEEVYYDNNRSITYIVVNPQTGEGDGLFGLKINPLVDSFELRIKFPEGTKYVVGYGNESFRGVDSFSIKVEKGKVPEWVYVQFTLSPELTKKVVRGEVNATIEIRMSKLPLWRWEDTIYIEKQKEGS
ncbi:hypothetical protein [Pyrococcus yayanosii]|uniref:Uncharacterized protein n=1 Tax=Pyrococcus yayanosii (strain CH1 / JCM 16557) TaxID=529709 RepID=F8AFR1_PYRYC|nr:hypothetical protein [Pyrococcus yayanosii]AEH25038.1 hypothetical protein PYCH_13680 [Pyrococcus yayanosii CH1]